MEDITADPGDAAIVTAIIAMGHSLRLKVVAAPEISIRVIAGEAKQSRMPAISPAISKDSGSPRHFVPRDNGMNQRFLWQMGIKALDLVARKLMRYKNLIIPHITSK